MPRRRSPDIFIVGLNIDKHDGYFGRRDGALVSMTQGVYLKAGADSVAAFQDFGFRIAARKFKDAAITHSCAWFRKPVEIYEGRKLQSIHVFIGGDFPYKVDIGGDLGEMQKTRKIPNFRIIQTMVNPDFTDELQYRKETFTDPIGSFEMYCATPELAALQMMEASKRHPEKRVDDSLLPDVAALLMKRHKNNPYAVLPAVDLVAKRANKQREFDRFVKLILPLMRATD